ncbi:MAG: hypothetical protein IPP72_18065 [Chitinophagaceae bacterium]|nr:hypothetical protein [Chitinophagaceae bacterium]
MKAEYYLLMTINTINNRNFELLSGHNITVARLTYTSNAFDKAEMETQEAYLLNGIATGTWVTFLSNDAGRNNSSKIRVETGGLMSVRFFSKKRKYWFKKSTGWKLRFSLSDKDGEELLTIIPSVNWQKESHDYILQLNDEFEKECDALLILHAVHCANCSLSMMTGGNVPALISI